MSKEDHDEQACCGACAYAALVAKNPSLEPITRTAPLLSGEKISMAVELPGGERNHLTFAQQHITVGRVPGNDLVLRDPTVSRKTCAFFFHQGTLFVEDLMSTCGTYVNGRAIRERTPLHRGDRVLVGGCVLIPDAS